MHFSNDSDERRGGKRRRAKGGGEEKSDAIERLAGQVRREPLDSWFESRSVESVRRDDVPGPVRELAELQRLADLRGRQSLRQVALVGEEQDRTRLLGDICRARKRKTKQATQQTHRIRRWAQAPSHTLLPPFVLSLRLAPRRRSAPFHFRARSLRTLVCEQRVQLILDDAHAHRLCGVDHEDDALALGVVVLPAPRHSTHDSMEK